MTVPDSVVSAAWLADRQREAAENGEAGPVVLDATALLPSPEFDGDYRLESGRARWSAAHIPGSRHVDLVGEFSDHSAPRHFTHLDPTALTEAVRRVGVVEGRDVVLYDDGGGIWAARLWWSLRAIGMPAAVLDGGLAAWQSAGSPIESGDEVAGADTVDSAHSSASSTSPHPRQLPVQPPHPLTLQPPLPQAWADIDEVAAISEGRAPGTLVCALGREQFDGSAPTRYSRRGHIPGSLNLPARSLVTPSTGLLATDAQLRESVRPLLDVPGPVVVYCGGGISAALLALGLVRAGREDVRIYDGSLEEWTADRERPVFASGS